MGWPIEALLLLVALAGCTVAAAAIQLAWAWRSWPLLAVGLATVGSLAAEVAALNGWWGPTLPGGVATVSLGMGAAAVAALAVYLLLPPPPPRTDSRARATGPAANPDSEA